MGRGLVERGKGSSEGGLDGGLWWFSDGDETKSQAGLTMMDTRWATARTPTKSPWPVWKEWVHHVCIRTTQSHSGAGRPGASGGTCRQLCRRGCTATCRSSVAPTELVPDRNGASLQDRFLSPGNGYPTPASFGLLALWPFPRRVPLCPLPSQPMMKPNLEYRRARRLED